MANVPYGISPRVFYAVALSFFVTSILHLATNAAIARLNMPRIFRVPRALICNVLLFVAFFVPALPLFFQDNRHQEDAPPFLASNQSAPLFWMLTGAVFFVFLHIGPAAPRARIAEPLPRSPLDIPPFGIFWSLIVFFVFDVLRFSASVIHENSFQYGWARSFKMWLHPFRNVHNATIWYSRRTILPYSIQALFRPVVKYLTGIEDLPEWLPQPPVGRIQFICEVILLSAVSLPDLAALVKPILRRSPRLAALSTVLDRAIFSPVNPQALEQRRYAWASLFWLSWIYVALGTVQALPALACVIKLFAFFQLPTPIVYTMMCYTYRGLSRRSLLAVQANHQQLLRNWRAWIPFLRNFALRELVLFSSICLVVGNTKPGPYFATRFLYLDLPLILVFFASLPVEQ